MKQRLLITGGTGFVGYHIIGKALEAGLDVFVATRASSAVAHLHDLGVNFTSLNLADTNALKKELEEKQYQFVIHAAGTTSAGTQREYNQVNAVFTSNLAKAAIEAQIPLKKFVFVSSLAAIGPSGEGVIDENKTMQPVTAYGESKKLAEQMLADIPGLPFITFRPTAVYGPRERDILIVLKTINRGFEPYIGKGPQRLSFVYAKDLAELMVQSLGTQITGRAYNVSDGGDYDRYALADITKSILERKTIRFHLPVGMVRLLALLLEKIGTINGKTPPLNRDKLSELTASWVCSIEAAKNDLNFQPKYNLQAGLTETLEWYKQNNWL